VPPVPAEQVRRTVAEDLGAPIEDLFGTFVDAPRSAASIGQVHACTLHDGREAVVKVQRPGLRDAMTRDLRVMYALARIIQRSQWGRSANVVGMVEDAAALTARELNPVVEAWNQDRFRERLGAFGDNKCVTAPEVYWERCGRQTICMERVRGIPMDDFAAIRERGIDGELVLRRGAKAWTEAVLVHGPFHGDLHAGNIWVLDDGRGCFLDFGIMGELDDEWRAVARDLYFSCVFDRDFTRIAAAYRRVGVFPPDMGTDEEIGERIGMILGPLLDAGMGSVNLGDLISSSVVLMKQYGGTPPQELMLVGKQLLYIERYTRELAPDYAVIKDPFLVRNVFPEAAEKLLADTGATFPE
jgi:predicted unusual protein kinase regulating ubiquinone biosynthesis (AarF/ABC1/UbiB family)